MTSEKNPSKARPGNENAVKHSGAAAVQRYSKNEPFTGVALEAADQVKHDLAEKGARSLLEENAVRLQTISNLYYQAILGARDIGEMTSLIKTWGWITNSATRAILALLTEDRSQGRAKADAVDVLQAIRKAQDETVND